MKRYNPTPDHDPKSIAQRIINDVIKIQTCGQWQEVTARLTAIQRSARLLLTDGQGAPASGPERELASGYCRAAMDQLEGAAYMINQMPDEELRDPQSMVLALTMLNMINITLGKAMRAQAVLV